MTELSDIVRQVTAEQTGSTIITAKAVTAGLPLVLANPEATEQAVIETLRRRVRDSVTRLSRTETKRVSKQASFFGHLRDMYAIDVEERVLKETTSLTRLEFRRIIAIRRDQIVADQAHMDLLVRAETELAPLWDAYPDLTFGEVEKLYIQRRGSGGGSGKAA